MRALERGGGRKSRQLGQVAHEMDAGHLRDESIALRHIADQALDLIGIAADVAAEDACGSRRRSMKAEQRMNQRRFSRAVRAQQTDCASAQSTVEFAQNGAATERDRQLLQINNRRVGVRSWRYRD